MGVNIAVVNLGRTTYHASLQLQSTISSIIKTKQSKWSGGVMLLMEYPHLYTIGINDKGYSVQDEQRLRQIGAEFYKTNRGGLITYHGPGQLIAYPIIDLKSWNKPCGIRWYIGKLEDTVIDMCQNMDITAHRNHSYPGIWVGEKKLCAIGVHASKFVTTHGIAINCNTDLNWFNHILPCGIEGKGVTSLTELLNEEISVTDVITTFLVSFQENFNCNLEITDLSDLNDKIKLYQKVS